MLSKSQPSVEQASYDNWNGGTYGYRLELAIPLSLYVQLGESLHAVEKELLQRLKTLTRSYDNEYVESVVISPTSEETPDSSVGAAAALPYWHPGFVRLFASHVATHKALAAEIRVALEDYGVSSFVAHDDIEPTEEWEDEIRRALQSCDALLAMLTEGYHESKWTDQEVGVAIGRNILVIPVRLGLDPYGFIGRYQGFPGLGQKPAELADGVARILAKNPRTQTKMASALVTRFEESDSFATAKQGAAHLGLVASWTDALKARVRNAIKTNGQISGAWGVSSRAESIIGKP